MLFGCQPWPGRHIPSDLLSVRSCACFSSPVVFLLFSLLLLTCGLHVLSLLLLICLLPVFVSVPPHILSVCSLPYSLSPVVCLLFLSVSASPHLLSSAIVPPSYLLFALSCLSSYSPVVCLLFLPLLLLTYCLPVTVPTLAHLSSLCCSP